MSTADKIAALTATLASAQAEQTTLANALTSAQATLADVETKLAAIALPDVSAIQAEVSALKADLTVTA